jgi:hypothetical protein
MREDRHRESAWQGFLSATWVIFWYLLSATNPDAFGAHRPRIAPPATDGGPRSCAAPRPSPDSLGAPPPPTRTSRAGKRSRLGRRAFSRRVLRSWPTGGRPAHPDADAPPASRRQAGAKPARRRGLIGAVTSPGVADRRRDKTREEADTNAVTRPAEPTQKKVLSLTRDGSRYIVELSC